MSETQNKPEMTKLDEEIVKQLNHLIELEQTGILKFFPIEHVLDGANETLTKIQLWQRARQTTASHQNSQASYAI
jgi:hypothetical protein